MSTLTACTPLKKQLHTKKGYLLGITHENEYVYLVPPSWDCAWYWGFGYIHTYTSVSRLEWDSHTHWDNSIVGEKCGGRTYCHHINENTNFKQTTLTEKESWLLAELMKSFYILREMSEFYHRGGAHVATNPCRGMFINESEENRINQVLLPALFNQIDLLLNPDHKPSEAV